MTRTPSNSGGHDPAFLTQAELAERWRMSVRTLDRWRDLAKGPPWLTLNGRIRYRLEDVEAFERSRLRQP